MLSAISLPIPRLRAFVCWLATLSLLTVAYSALISRTEGQYNAGRTFVLARADALVDITETPPPGVRTVSASGETDPVHHSGDAADDPAVWIHPTDPALSTIIGTDKLGGLAVYDLSGQQLFYYPDSHPNNVDIRYNFPLGGQRVTLVTTSDRVTDSIRVYKVNPSTRGLEYVAARTISVGLGIAGLCMYHSPISGKYYVFDSDSSGTIQQWELRDNGAGSVDAVRVRQFSVGSTTEGCVADDEAGRLYISEEDVAIWRYGAEPNAGTARTQVDTTGSGGHLTRDIEGLSIYYGTGGTGYLIASSQGSNNFVIYERQSNAYVTTFTIGAGLVDAVTHTDGQDVSNFGLGSAYPEGLFIAQDDLNGNPGGTGDQNFKLVPWGNIARSGNPQLIIDTSWDPRLVGAGNLQTPTNTPGPTLTPAPCTPGTFSDVPPDHTFYPFVTCLVSGNIISGYSDCTFRPNNLVTRGQLAKIVSNAAAFTENPDPQIFEDVPASNTFYQWINRLARRGHMSGYLCGGPGEPCLSGMPYFRPSANATRGQTSKIVSNAAGYSEIPAGQTFEDLPPTHAFYREIQRLASRNIMQGYACGSLGEPCISGRPYFRPQNNVTRGQSAKIVANTFFRDCQTP